MALWRAYLANERATRAIHSAPALCVVTPYPLDLLVNWSLAHRWIADHFWITPNWVFRLPVEDPGSRLRLAHSRRGLGRERKFSHCGGNSVLRWRSLWSQLCFLGPIRQHLGSLALLAVGSLIEVLLVEMIDDNLLVSMSKVAFFALRYDRWRSIEQACLRINVACNAFSVLDWLLVNDMTVSLTLKVFGDGLVNN